jgi:hypothetical protein
MRGPKHEKLTRLQLAGVRSDRENTRRADVDGATMDLVRASCIPAWFVGKSKLCQAPAVDETGGSIGPQAVPGNYEAPKE